MGSKVYFHLHLCFQWMVRGQAGANGVSAVRLVEEVGGREIGSVHPLCMGGSLAMGSHLRLVAAEMMAAVVRIKL